MLQFSTPWLLFALPAALLPLLLYWWKRRQKRKRRFPSLRLIRQTVAEQARRLRIREILLLLLRILALAFLILAMAGPLVRPEGMLKGSPERVVVLLDRSLSMTAEDGAGERFERAKSACARYLKLLPSGTRVDLVTFDEGPSLVADSVEPLEALSVLGGIGVGLGGTDLGAALDYVDSRLNRRKESAVVALFSDLPADGVVEPLHFEYPLLVYPAGLPAQNGGIVELTPLNPFPLAGVELEVTAEVTGPLRDYRLFAGGEEIAFRGSVGGRFRLGVIPAGPGWTVYRLSAEPTDAFGVDDVRRLAILVHPPPLVYTFGDLGLIPTVLDTAPALVERTGYLDDADVIIWDARRVLRPEEEALLKDRLEDGVGLMIAVPPVDAEPLPSWLGVGPVSRRVSPVGYSLGPVVENDVTRPLGGPLSELSRMVIADQIALPLLGEDWSVFLRYAGGEPAMAYRRDRGGIVLLWLLPFRLDDGPFAAIEAFPPLLIQAIRFCAFGEAEPATYTAGTVLSLPAASGSRLVAPDGGETALGDGGPLQVELDQIGVWRLESPDGVRLMSVNAPGGEGELTPLSPEDFALIGPTIEVLSDEALAGETGAGSFPLWRVLLALTGVLLIVELALADARWR